jgi:tRNA(Ile)-lysidine synthetase-like protein
MPTGSRLLVAVSGGADSTALLLGLGNVAREFGLQLHAAHLHHGLRGADADADLTFVRHVCEEREIPLTSARWNARLRLRRRGLSGEAGLRTLRREFLVRAARRAGALGIVTAHTADDQLETILMRLARGAGVTGLSGMRPRHGAWLKPLLEATRAEIEADLRRVGQAWREDRSNRDPRHARNRVRHEVIPALVRALDPAADAVRGRASLARKATRSARELGAVARSLESLVRDALSAVCRIQPGEIALDSARVASYPYTARRMMLRQLWSQLDPSLPGLTDRHLEALSGLLSAGRGARVSLAGGWVAERDRTWIRFRSVASIPSASRRRPAEPGRSRVAELAQT